MKVLTRGPVMMSCFSYLHACILLFCMFFCVHMHGFFRCLFLFIFLFACMIFLLVVLLLSALFCFVFFCCCCFFLFCFFACIVFFVRCGHLFCLFVSFFVVVVIVLPFLVSMLLFSFFYPGVCWMPALKRTGKNLIKIVKTPHSNKKF